MAKDVIMPALGMAQESGVLIKWLVPEGGSVAEGDPLMEVETDKAVVEVPSPVAGTLANVTVEEGDEVPVGTVMAVLLGAGEVRELAASPTNRDASPASSPPAPAAAVSAGPVSGAPTRQAPEPTPGQTPPGRVLASPKAKRLAAERGLDLASVGGSGPGGAVRAVDLAVIDTGSAARGAERQAAVVAAPTPLPLPALAGAAAVDGFASLDQPPALDAVWFRLPVDASGLAEFVARCNARLERAGGPTLASCDVLARAVMATLARRAPGQLAGGTGGDAWGPGLAVALSVTDGAGQTMTTRLAGSDLGSMYAVAAARSSAGSQSTPTGEGRSGASHSFIAIADRSATRYQRSPEALPEAVGLRFSLGPSLEGVALSRGGAGAARVATLTLEVRPGLLSEGEAVGLLNGVASLLEDPFGIVVFG